MPLFTDKRVSALVWLAAMAAVAVLGHWYPMAVANRNASPDDRFGGALLMGMPFVWLASIVAIWSYVRLLKALTKAKAELPGAAILGVLGGLLLVLSVATSAIVALTFFR